MKEIDKYGNFYKNSEIYFDEIQLLAIKNYGERLWEKNLDFVFYVFWYSCLIP